MTNLFVGHLVIWSLIGLLPLTKGQTDNDQVARLTK
jgi:hypothetical protein